MTYIPNARITISGGGYRTTDEMTATGGAAGSFGAYKQVTDSLATSISIFGFNVENKSIDNYSRIAIATGTAGAETIISSFRMYVPKDGISGMDGKSFFLPYGINVAQGTRLSVAFMGEKTASGVAYISLCFVNQSDIG